MDLCGCSDTQFCKHSQEVMHCGLATALACKHLHLEFIYFEIILLDLEEDVGAKSSGLYFPLGFVGVTEKAICCKEFFICTTEKLTRYYGLFQHF